MSKFQNPIPGRGPDDCCPEIGCGGRLVAVVAKDSVIERLACTECSRSFEARDRGVAIEDHLAKQVESFKNPQVRMKYCMHCAGMEDLKEGNIVEPDPFVIGADRAKQRYLYCNKCYTVAHVFPQEELPQLEDDGILLMPTDPT